MEIPSGLRRVGRAANEHAYVAAFIGVVAPAGALFAYLKRRQPETLEAAERNKAAPASSEHPYGPRWSILTEDVIASYDLNANSLLSEAPEGTSEVHAE